MRNVFVLGIVGAVATSATAQVTLNALMAADDSFQASISTTPDADGTNFLNGASLFITYTGSIQLPGPGTYYLHVRAEDFGGQKMLIGSFTLDSIEATFSNGTQELLTTHTHWSVSDTGFGVGAVAPVVVPNGWGSHTGLEAASYIWHPSLPSVAYFTTQIVVIPTPASLALLGLAACGRRRRR